MTLSNLRLIKFHLEAVKGELRLVYDHAKEPMPIELLKSLNKGIDECEKGLNCETNSTNSD